MESLASTDKGQFRVSRRRPLMLSSLGAVAVFSLLVAGCGGKGSPRVASVASSTPVTTTRQTGPVAFARCMRSHGVSAFPDPNSSGAFDGNTLKQLKVSVSRIRAAQGGCSHLLPNGLVPTAPGYTITRTDQLDYLKGAACMRTHGFAGFPDPTFQNHGVQLNIPSNINQGSPQFKSAAATCQKLIPAGLPYSGTD